MNINTLHGATDYLLEFCGYTQKQIESLPVNSIISFAKEYYSMHLLFTSIK